MDVEVPVLSGYLNVPSQSGFALNIISKKKSCQKYCLLFKSSCHGIERLEICESKDDKNPKIVTLENCVKITQEPAPNNIIHIVKKTGTLTLSTYNEEDLKEWISALQKVAFRNKNEVPSLTVIEEDNDLYCSSYSDGLFIVTLLPSDVSIRSNIESKTFMLHLSTTELQLKSADDINNTIAAWPYRFIRKYGYRHGKFTFEAGRKCSTGEGVFILDHPNPQEIFRCMSSKMKSMKKLISADSGNAGFVETGENQLNIAASMEARSRSPLPPSNQSNSDFEIASTQSCLSVRMTKSPNDSVNSNLSGTTTTLISKIIPNKPSRKTTLPSEKSSSNATAQSHLSLHQHQQSSQHNSEIFKKFNCYDSVSITTSHDPTKANGSTVLIKPLSPNTLRKTGTFDGGMVAPNLPARTDKIAKPVISEQDYESIETITEAWKTLGIDDIKHTERRCTVAINEDDFKDFVWQRSQSHREKSQKKESMPSLGKTTKLIDIDIGENNGPPTSTDIPYDKLNFLSANNKTSSGYKTIVTVTAPCNRTRATKVQNEYEFIEVLDNQSQRKSDDNFLDYGVLKKFNSKCPQPLSTQQNKAADSTIISNGTLPDISRSENDVIDHLNCNGLNYTIVSKPKRV